jgi:glucose/arabinose dehydrogenase
MRCVLALSVPVLVLLAACASSAGNSSAPSNPTATSAVVNTPIQPTVTLAQPAMDATPTDGATLEPVAPAPTPTPREDALKPAASLPDPAGFEWRVVASGLEKPNGLGYANDGSGRLFVLEQRGVIRVAQDDRLLAQPLMDISDRVGSDASERGLLGIAFHPDFANNGFFYVNYTDKQGNTVIARFTAQGETADPASEMVLLRVDQPYANHNGGMVAFGLDGYLYLGLGDGGSAGDPQNHAQSLNTHLGKLLRLDVDGGEPYVVPADNPFASQPDALPEIWAYGLRNPWRFSFDRATGDLYIGDVGQGQWEEIDFLPAGTPGGANFGWRLREGAHPYANDPQPESTLVEPVFEYNHSQGCSVTGGVVYRGQALPEMNGVYLLGDYCSGLVWGIVKSGAPEWDGQVLWETGYSITSFGEDAAGEVYLTDYNGSLVKLVRR